MTDSSEALKAPSADAPERRFIVSRSGRVTRKLVGGPTKQNPANCPTVGGVILCLCWH
jgi:hypothetical protein